MGFQCWPTHKNSAKRQSDSYQMLGIIHIPLQCESSTIAGSGHVQASMFQFFCLYIRTEESQITSNTCF